MRSLSIALAFCCAVAGAHALSARGSDNAVVLPGPGMFWCTVASVHDGDTFTCAERDHWGHAVRVRLSGVDARELGNFCAPGHPCASASADDATAGLSSLALGQHLWCHAENESYGRIAAFCRRPDGTDLSCAMLRRGLVARWDRYWGAHRCP